MTGQTNPPPGRFNRSAATRTGRDRPPKSCEIKSFGCNRAGYAHPAQAMDPMHVNFAHNLTTGSGPREDTSPVTRIAYSVLGILLSPRDKILLQAQLHTVHCRASEHNSLS